MADQLSRRGFITSTTLAGAALGAGVTASGAGNAAPAGKHAYQDGLSPWPLAMNTSTIRPASLEDKIKVTAEAGWDAIELWIDDLNKYEEDGGDLKELGREIKDRGLFVNNIIGLWGCMPATKEEFDASLEATRKRMRQSADVGSTYVAAIPAPDRPDFDIKWGADRYRDLLKIGREEFGITVAFEFIGFLKGIHRFGQACAIALDSNDPNACLVNDTFHLWRGGSGFSNLGKVDGSLIANFHWNDVKASTEREGAGDDVRVYPGDGDLPLEQALRDLKAIGFDKTLSLEVFNREYWKQDPKEVAETGLRKMRACIARAEL
jgi:sugar phosphate isomerase/epimerase